MYFNSSYEYQSTSSRGNLLPCWGENVLIKECLSYALDNQPWLVFDKLGKGRATDCPVWAPMPAINTAHRCSVNCYLQHLCVESLSSRASNECRHLQERNDCVRACDTAAELGHTVLDAAFSVKPPQATGARVEQEAHQIQLNLRWKILAFYSYSLFWTSITFTFSACLDAVYSIQ